MARGEAHGADESSEGPARGVGAVRRAVPLTAVFELNQAKAANWRRWVLGDLSGYPDDETALNAANDADRARIIG